MLFYYLQIKLRIIYVFLQRKFTVTMIITELQQLYAAHPNVEGMCRLLKNNSVRHLYCSGLCASAASLFSSVLVQRAECPFVFILGDLEEAGYFYHDLTQILGAERVLFFPSSFRRAIKYGQKDAANEILRTEVLSRLQKGEEGLCVVTCPDALAEKVVSRKELGDKTLKLHTGEKVDMDFVTEVLRSYGFEYVASTLDRVRLAALAQSDADLQMPIMSPVSPDAWAVKESTASEEDEPEWGSREERAIGMEVSTAAANLTGGADAVIMRHPAAVATIKKFITDLV